MENPDRNAINDNNNNHTNKRTIRRNSNNSHISISDTESITSQVDSFHSPLRSDSPIRSDDPYFQPENDNPNRALVLVDKYYSPVPSPGKSNFPATPPPNGGKSRRPWPQSDKPNSENVEFPAKIGVNRFVRDEPPQGVKKVGPIGGGGVAGLEEGRVDEVGGEKQSRAAVASILRRSDRSVAVRRVALGLRLFGMVVCLVSFSVMAADKTQGWSGDSFDRYKEYRYCLAVNVIGFVYSGFQAFDLAYHFGTGKHIISQNLHYNFDFPLDQIIAYLLISASSSAATRVDDWVSNWGRDEFTLKASASIAMSFLAFAAFALSSLLSGYNFCNRDSA